MDQTAILERKLNVLEEKAVTPVGLKFTVPLTLVLSTYFPKA